MAKKAISLNNVSVSPAGAVPAVVPFVGPSASVETEGKQVASLSNDDLVRIYGFLPRKLPPTVRPVTFAEKLPLSDEDKREILGMSQDELAASDQKVREQVLFEMAPDDISKMFQDAVISAKLRKEQQQVMAARADRNRQRCTLDQEFSHGDGERHIRDIDPVFVRDLGFA